MRRLCGHPYPLSAYAADRPILASDMVCRHVSPLDDVSAAFHVELALQEPEGAGLEVVGGVRDVQDLGTRGGPLLKA